MSIKTIVGRLGDVPEVRVTQSGKHVASFSVAETKRRFNKDTNAWEDEFTIWHDCETWNAVEQVAQLTKGADVIVVGEERDASYTHRESQKLVRRMVVRASAMGPLIRAPKQGDVPAAAPQSADTWSTPSSGNESWGGQW